MKTMSVRFDPRDMARIAKIARRRGISSSEFVRDAAMSLAAMAESAHAQQTGEPLRKDGDV